MQRETLSRRGLMSRYFAGPDIAEAFILIAVATILITRLYLKLTGYPQVGGGNLHIAHTLYGELLMMLALLTGWLALGAGARRLAVVLAGVGFGLVLDEVGKFVTKDNDYFYGPAAEIMYLVVVIVLLGARAIRDLRPLSGQECLSSAAVVAADGVARGLGDRRRETGLRLVERARREGADPEDAQHVQALLLSARTAPDRVAALERWAPRLVPDIFGSPRWVPVLGWLIVLAAIGTLFLHTLGAALGGHEFRAGEVTFHLAGMNVGTAILLIGAVLTVAMALPATLSLTRSNRMWPLQWLRNAALLFTLLSAMVHFATEGFAALITLSIGLFAMAMLNHQLTLRERAELPTDTAHRVAGSPTS